ncbi:transglutaminase-like domain-containing protein [Sphingomonas solaris]|uniref:Transglutaminase family protein n=1 Tax=Alterirhizorhabdus solaris TaxID=2529389 RepID=A0A558QS66_9SPHN|nr:transglutaminase family protein [Sphingomonas solaris]TVV69965.1 transglutaminase family protein [Sphingomonas solaris]
MLIRAGFDIEFATDTPSAMLALLNIHPSRNRDLRTPHRIETSREVPTYDYVDDFGNLCTRLTVPAGGLSLHADFIIEDSGFVDRRAPDVPVTPVDELPENVLGFLLGSRYCETQHLMQAAWGMFGHIQSARGRVEAIVDFVHNHITFGYQFARGDRTAWNGYQERVGVCRDFAHLAVTLCRCMNIPARYCTGYLGDIGVPVVDAPMDFSAWFDVFVGGDWYTYDARHNQPRIGRILMARGRDATDTALTTVFGPAWLKRFEVTTYEVSADELARFGRPPELRLAA